MGKTRVGVLLRESVGSSKNVNKSADLVALTERYNAFVKKMKFLIHSLQQNHAAMLQMEKTRHAVAHGFAGLSKNSPMWEATGLMPSADRPSNTVCSYASVHDQLAAKTKSYAGKYQQFVLEYAVEWEKVVTARVNAGLKKTEELRRELNHYQKKVESLRLSANQAMAKGKTVPPSTAEKLSRNEEKLIQSKQNYNKAATDMCILMEEVAERSWRDLHPLLIKCAQFDMTLSSDESQVLSSMNQVVNQLKQVATANGLSPQPRLKDLASLKPELLSTRPGGVSGLAIESGAGAGSPLSTPGGGTPGPIFGTPESSMAQPPGTVAPQGMGGFPVQVASIDPSPSHPPPQHTMSRGSSFSSQNSTSLALTPAPASSLYEPPSTMSMLTISQAAAPPPTLEDVYSAQHSSTSIRSAPSSGNLPPLPPSGSGGFNHRSASFSDVDSVYSGSGYNASSPLAAAPAGPPPPPPSMPPPPPPVDYGAAPPMAAAMVLPPTGRDPPSYPPAHPWSSTSDPPPTGTINLGAAQPPALYSTNPFDS